MTTNIVEKLIINGVEQTYDGSAAARTTSLP